MYLYYTFYDLLFAQNCSYETSSFKNKPILKFSVLIYHEYIYDNFCWKVFDKRNLTWFDWDTYYMRGSRIFFPWGRDDGVCPGGVGGGGERERLPTNKTKFEPLRILWNVIFFLIYGNWTHHTFSLPFWLFLSCKAMFLVHVFFFILNAKVDLFSMQRYT